MGKAPGDPGREVVTGRDDRLGAFATEGCPGEVKPVDVA